MESDAEVLVVDDDPMVAEVVTAYLTRAGLRVRRASDGPSAVACAEAHLPDLVVLDLMLPGLDGFEVYRRISELGPVPVIMLTARGAEGDRVRGLELGADDYVTKPFSPRELVLRARSVLRRSRPVAADTAETPAPRIRKAGDLTLDAAGHRATKAGRPLSLTSREFDLLAFFADNPGQVFTRTELMRQVWGWEYGDESTVTVHVRRLREKIEDDPHQPKMIVTIWGVGYRFDPEGPDGDAAAEPPAGGREAGS